MRRRAADDADASDVEPVDLEPIVVDPQPAPPRPPRPHRPASWVVVVVAVLALVWAGFAYSTRHHSQSRTAQPVAAPETNSLPTSFVEKFAGIGTSRFAVVVDGHLYLLDGRARSSTPVDLGDGAEPVTIEDQSRRELLVKTQDHNVILDTTGAETMSIRSDESALSLHNGSWSFVGANRELAPNDAGPAVHIAPGIEVLGTMSGDYIVADNHGFAFWDRATGTTRPIASHATKLLATTADAALFEGACPTWCDEVVYADGTTRTFAAPDFVDRASLSPDGHRVAFGNAVYDTTTGRLVASLTLPTTASPMPYAWTDDGTLLIAIDGAVAVLRPNDRDTHEIIGLNGLTQIAALP